MWISVYVEEDRIPPEETLSGPELVFGSKKAGASSIMANKCIRFEAIGDF